jgi:hypothetical protein
MDAQLGTELTRRRHSSNLIYLAVYIPGIHQMLDLANIIQLLLQPVKSSDDNIDSHTLGASLNVRILASILSLTVIYMYMRQHFLFSW